MIGSTTLEGRIELVMRGHLWKKRHSPPLYLSLLDRQSHWEALPTDQSGGLRGGDRHTTVLELYDRAGLLWSPPAATLFHPCAPSTSKPNTSPRAPSQEPAGGASLIETALRIDGGSRLHFCPRASIPCLGAVVRQSTVLELDAKSSLLYWDLWASGRSASGEEWDFASVSNELSVLRDGGLIFRERWSLEGLGGRGETMSPAAARHGPDRGPAGLQDSRMWFLGLAQGELEIQRLRDLVASAGLWNARGEIGQLDEGLWIGRFMGPRAVGGAFPASI